MQPAPWNMYAMKLYVIKKLEQYGPPHHIIVYLKLLIGQVLSKLFCHSLQVVEGYFTLYKKYTKQAKVTAHKVNWHRQLHVYNVFLTLNKCVNEMTLFSTNQFSSSSDTVFKKCKSIHWTIVIYWFIVIFHLLESIMNIVEGWDHE